MLETPTNKPFPLVKWVGGKRQLQTPILAKIAEVFDGRKGTYFEPFLGGGAILFALEPAKAEVSDINAGLINLYKQIKHDYQEVKEALVVLENEYNSLSPEAQLQYFLSQREEFNLRDGESFVNRTEVAGAAKFIFLNKTGFNGMYRENAAGAFNIPFGKRNNVSLFDEANLEATSKLLQNVDLHNQPYKDTVRSAKPGDLVYFDPPYAPLTKTSSFEGYNAANLGGFDQKALKDVVDELTDAKVFCLVSNSSASEIEGLYSDYNLEPLSANRAISASASGRKPVKEYLIDNFKHVQK